MWICAVLSAFILFPTAVVWRSIIHILLCFPGQLNQSMVSTELLRERFRLSKIRLDSPQQEIKAVIYLVLVGHPTVHWCNNNMSSWAYLGHWWIPCTKSLGACKWTFYSRGKVIYFPCYQRILGLFQILCMNLFFLSSVF
jgi:hypothetical protein